MSTTTQRGSRPLAVNIALVILLINFGTSLVPRLAYAEWNDLFVRIKYGSEIIMLLLTLWFIFRGKNWARWLLLAVGIAEFCLSVPRVIQHFQNHSASRILTYCLRSLVDVVALVALFHPSTNEWFLRDRRKRRDRQRRQADVEAQIRKEYQQRLSETGDYWQNTDIEAEIVKLVKVRMKLIHDTRAV